MTTVLIAGANRGLGLEFARQYLADGAHVIAGARRPDEASELRAMAEQAGGRLEVHALDVSDAQGVEGFKLAVAGRPIDILIANAGVYGGDAQSFGGLDYDAWLHTFQINALGPVRLAEAFVDNLKAGHDKKLVAITSQMGSIADSSGGAMIYRSSKAALNMAFHGVALALKAAGVTAAMLHPGWVQTDMGGKGATLTPEQSITGLRRVIAGLTLADTGAFRDHAGKTLPW